VVWSPDGQRIIYDKSDFPSADNPLGLPSLWWLDLATNQTGRVFPNSQWPGLNPGWSPDGQWLNYTSPGSGQVEIYNLKDGRRHTIPGQTTGSVAWQPDSSTLLIEAVRTQAAGFLTHLLRFNLESGQLVDLSGAANAEDTAAAWSPDGQWIAVVRRELSNPDEAKNLQLWVMRADGSQARRLTSQVDALYGPLSWSPDGKYLLFHQYVLKKQKQPDIWLLNIQTGELQVVASPGYWPAWLP
jgi:TolB protein